MFQIKYNNCPHQHDRVVTLVGLFPLRAARPGERRATAAFVRRNALPSVQAGLSAHSYNTQKTKVFKSFRRIRGTCFRAGSHLEKH